MEFGLAYRGSCIAYRESLIADSRWREGISNTL